MNKAKATSAIPRITASPFQHLRMASSPSRVHTRASLPLGIEIKYRVRLYLNGQIIWVFVNLLILFLLMKKFLFGPITRMLDARSKGVSDTLDQADARLAEAEQSKQKYDKQLADARSQAAQIIAESRKRADLAYSRRMEEAEQDVQRLNEQAARQREADRQVMLDEAKQEIAALVMLATAKVSKQVLDSDSDKAMVSAFLDEAGDEE